MPIQTSDYISVKDRALSLGCNTPTGIAILPENFVNARTKGELFYGPAAYDLRENFQNGGIPETPLENEGDEFLTHLQESEISELILPTIFVGYALYVQNPHLIDLALSVIANYITDWFKNIGGKQSTTVNAELNIVVETNGRKCVKVKYKGPVAGLDKVRAIVREINSRD